nr:AtpZ/AtpI family protein [uncultured Mucilaginibacter sp.]
MDENEQKDNPGTDKPINSYLKYSAMGFQMIAIIGVFTFIGYKIDASANHQTKWVTAILSLVGVFGSLYIVIRSLKN